MSIELKGAPSPLFVVGVQRSGTTWLANTLCNHSQVYGIQSPQYFGIKESWFFSHLEGRFGSLSQPQNYCSFLELFTKTTFFKLSQVNPQELEKINPKGYSDFFRTFMETSAKTGATGERLPQYWLEKSNDHTLSLRKLCSSYPDVKIVGIEREILDVIRSQKRRLQNYRGEEKMPASYLPRAVYHWHKYRSYLHYFRNRFPEQFIIITYEELKSETAAQITTVLSFLGLEWEPGVLEIKYGVNTSFKNGEREEALSQRERKMIGALGTVARFLPHALFEWHEKLRRPGTMDEFEFLYY